MAVFYTILGLAIAGGIGYGLWYYFTKVRKKKSVVTPPVVENNGSNKQEDKKEESKPAKEEVEIKLNCIKREKGTGIGGYETYEEAGKRISKLSKEEFAKLEVNDKPWSQEQWAKEGLTQDEILARNKLEQSLIFRYLPNGKEIPQHAEILTRKFPK